MFFFVALISIISHAENIYGEHSWYSFDIPEAEQKVCTEFADLSYTSHCSNYYPELGPQSTSTYCVYEYIACCCAHCLECYDPNTFEPTLEPTVEPTKEPSLEPTVEPTLLPTTEPTLEPTAEPSLQPTAEPTLKPTTAKPTVQPTVVPTVQPTVEPTPTTTISSTMEDDGLVVVDTEAAEPVSTSDSGTIAVSTEILFGFMFVSFWILCCGGFWVYYKSNKQKSVEKFKQHIPERKVEIHTTFEPIEKISIEVGSECAIAQPDSPVVINMDQLATAEGTTVGAATVTAPTPGGLTLGEEQFAGEGAACAETGGHSRTRSLEPASAYLNAAAIDDRRSRTNTNQTVSTMASIGTVHDSYFPEAEDSSMDLYEDTFERIDREGPARSGSPPRMSEGGLVTGFDAQNMMHKNVVGKDFDEYDLKFNAAAKQAKKSNHDQHMMVLDPQLSPVQSSIIPTSSDGSFYAAAQPQPEKNDSLFGDDTMDNAVDIPIVGLDNDSIGLGDSEEVNLYSY